MQSLIGQSDGVSALRHAPGSRDPYRHGDGPLCAVRAVPSLVPDGQRLQRPAVAAVFDRALGEQVGIDGCGVGGVTGQREPWIMYGAGDGHVAPVVPLPCRSAMFRCTVHQRHGVDLRRPLSDDDQYRGIRFGQERAQGRFGGVAGLIHAHDPHRVQLVQSLLAEGDDGLTAGGIDGNMLLHGCAAVDHIPVQIGGCGDDGSERARPGYRGFGIGRRGGIIHDDADGPFTYCGVYGLAVIRGVRQQRRHPLHGRGDGVDAEIEFGGPHSAEQIPHDAFRRPLVHRIAVPAVGVRLCVRPTDATVVLDAQIADCDTAIRILAPHGGYHRCRAGGVLLLKDFEDSG